MAYNGSLTPYWNIVFMEKYDIYNDARIVFSTVSSLQDAHKCRMKKEKHQSIGLIRIISSAYVIMLTLNLIEIAPLSTFVQIF